MVIGIPKETFPNEQRVALIPDVVPALIKLGCEVIVESGAGTAAGFLDEAYEKKQAKVVSNRADLFAQADIIAQVRTLGSNPDAGKSDLELMKTGQIIIGFAEPLSAFDEIKAQADKGVTLLSMELMPRITRAQSMDVLSSMATVAGYQAVLMAATRLPRFFPMFMTAAGTVSPAKVFVIGGGVAGLQAIATAKRLGAVVSGYDIRPAVKEQVESLGAKFVEMELDTDEAEDSGGYAKAMGEEFYKKQRELMTKVVADSDVVIATAAIPGRKSPLLVTEEAVKLMAPGSVIVDLAAERGGNCELTKADEEIVVHNVKILGPTNLPSTIPYHASQMYSKNVLTYLRHLIKDGEVVFDMADEITLDTVVTQGGEVVQARVREMMGLTVKTEEK